MTHILYNPLSDNKKGYNTALALGESLGEEVTYDNLLEIKSMEEFLSSISDDDKVIIAGGDGTINRFANDIGDFVPTFDIFYYPTGTGNDFMKDVEAEAKDGMIKLNEYIKDLPTVTVNGITKKFINGVGYGIDGYCCEVGDKLKENSDKPVNYASIAIKGMLFHFKPADAVVTVDGVRYEYKKVWIAPTMNGRYYGGGMKVAPNRDRLKDKDNLSLIVFHGSGKLKTLMIFKSIFTGEHIKHEKVVKQHTGKEITVEFSHPTALQIDGETVIGVTSYTARAK